MAKEKIRNYLEQGTRYNNLTYITAAFFILLVAEKITACISAGFWQGTADFSFDPSFSDIFSMLIYVSMAVLILLKVDYKYLLIPDGLLFLSKLSHMAEGFTHLFPLEKNDILTQITAIEEIVDNFLFMVFLMIFFSGKILKKMSSRIRIFIPYVCIMALLFTFPTTLVLETVKVLIEAEFYSYTIGVMTFNFIKAIANEAFLDLPYFMLVLMVYFKPHKF